MRVDLINLYRNKIANATYSVVNTTSTPKLYEVEIGIPEELSYVTSKISKGTIAVSQKNRVSGGPGSTRLNYYTWKVGTLVSGQGASITVTVKVVQEVTSSYINFDDDIIEIAGKNIQSENTKTSKQDIQYKTIVLCADQFGNVTLPENSDSTCINKLLNLVKSVKEEEYRLNNYNIELQLNEAALVWQGFPFNNSRFDFGAVGAGDELASIGFYLQTGRTIRTPTSTEYSGSRNSMFMIAIKNCKCFLIVLFGNTINLSERDLLDYFNVKSYVPVYEVKLIKDSCKTSEGVGVHFLQDDIYNSIFFTNNTSAEASFSYSDGSNTFVIKVPPYISYRPEGTGYGFFIDNNFFGTYIVIVNYISSEGQNCKAEYIIKRK